jgi:hypothetical protein
LFRSEFDNFDIRRKRPRKRRSRPDPVVVDWTSDLESLQFVLTVKPMLQDLAGITGEEGGVGGGGGILPDAAEWESIERMCILLAKFAEAEEGFEIGFRRSRRGGGGGGNGCNGGGGERRSRESAAAEPAAAAADEKDESNMRTMPDVQNVVPEFFDLQVF